MHELPAVIGTLIPISGIAMIVLIVWFGERRKEKESLYRNELLRKIAESQGDAAQRVLEIIHQQDRERQIRIREGIKLAGMITLAVGLGLIPMLAMIVRNRPVWTVGLIPALVGVALFSYVYFLSPQPDKENYTDGHK
jgi:hypothetical protein